MAPDLSWGYRLTRMSGKARRGGGVFGGRGRRYQTRRQWAARVAQTLGFTKMTAVEMLGSVDELPDATVRSIDAATVAGIGPYRKSRPKRRSQNEKDWKWSC